MQSLQLIRKFYKLFQFHILIFIIFASTAEISAQEKSPVRLGVLSIAQPARVFASWSGFAEYLSERLDRPVEIVIPRGFGRMAKAVEAGDVDFFYVNSHVFYRLSQAGAAFGVAQMINLDGKPTSRSDIFVRGDSSIKAVTGLRGKKVAFVSPMGAGGYLAPRAYLQTQGINTTKDLNEEFTKNLSNSIYGVLLGEIDGATMCGVNYRLMSEKIETGELVIIGTTDDYPENVIAARADLEPELAERIADIVTSMKDGVAGRELLEKMRGSKISDFIPYDPEIERITEKLLKEGKFDS